MEDSLVGFSHWRVIVLLLDNLGGPVVDVNESKYMNADDTPRVLPLALLISTSVREFRLRRRRSWLQMWNRGSRLMLRLRILSLQTKQL